MKPKTALEDIIRITAVKKMKSIPLQRRIQDFPDGRGCQPLDLGQKPIIWQDFAKNCMKMKEFGLREGTRDALGIRQCSG